MNFIVKQLENENGAIMAVVLLIMALLTIVAVSSSNTSIAEQQTASSERLYMTAFYAAEAGRSYVVQNPDLYHAENITVDGYLNFPDTDEPVTQHIMNNLQAFNGEVQYIGGSLPPRESGFEVGKFRSHRYQLTSSGYGPRNSSSRVEAGFYRIGF